MPTLIAAVPKSIAMIGMGRCLLAIARCTECRSITSLIGGRTTAINGALPLSGFDRRSPHSFVQTTYLGEQSVNLVSFFATQQRDPVGGILFQRSLQFA